MVNTKAERIEKARDSIKKERPDYGHILDLFGKIMVKQSEFFDRTTVKPAVIAEDAVRVKLEKNTSLLDRKDFEIDISSASRLFRELCVILKAEDQKLADEIRKIEDALEKDDLPLGEIFQSVLANDDRVSELAEELSLDRDVIFVLATASMKPSLEATASQVEAMVGDGSWSGRCCPICGSSPSMSELSKASPSGGEGATSEGAERILHCSFCGNEWRTTRLGCVFCGNTDAESLRYLYAEGDEGHRIDVCEKCKNYMKTVDSRHLSREIVLPLEDIGTLHLDIIAEEEGYKREAWFMPFSI